jgi:hypothetical protein
MRWDLIQMRWPQYRLLARRRWRELSDAQLTEMCGLKELLVQSLQASYGMSREVAECDIDSWTSTFEDDVHGLRDEAFAETAAAVTGATPAAVMRRPDPRRRSDPRR